MAPKKDWNVDRCFDETETDVQWKLRKSFLLTHKDKYPKSRLVSLAKTFANIQFLGCRYNNDLMQLIENLAKDIPAVIDYRKEQKSKLQSMFVMASDVAAKTVKNERYQPPQNFTKKFGDFNPPQPMEKFKPNDQNRNGQLNLSPEDQLLLNRVQNQKGIKSKFIIVSRSYINQDPFSILIGSADMLHMKLRVERVSFDEYVLKINEEIIVSGTAPSGKVARVKLAEEALIHLQDHCFHLVIDKPSEEQSADFPRDKVVAEAVAEVEESTALPEDNIGAKMMKLMGWKGKGLGKEEHGRQEPIIAERRIDRLGLGVDKEMKNLKIQTEKFLKDYVSKVTQQNLVFSGFGKTERAIIHNVAMTFKLRSVSYGKEPNRRLFVSTKHKPWKMVMDLLANRECHGRLIKPKKMMGEFETQKLVMDPLENQECPDNSLNEPDEMTTRKRQKLMMDPLVNQESPEDSQIEPNKMTKKVRPRIRKRKADKMMALIANQEYSNGFQVEPNEMTTGEVKTRNTQELVMDPLENQEYPDNSLNELDEMTTRKRQKLMMDPLVNQESPEDSQIEPNKISKKNRRLRKRKADKETALIANQVYSSGFLEPSEMTRGSKKERTKTGKSKMS